MTFVLAVLAFPLLLAVLSLGVGLLVQRLVGMTLPALLLAPLGFAAIVGVSQLTTWSGVTAPLTPAIVVVLALAGIALSWRATAARRRGRRSGWWWGWVAGLGAYLTAAAPVILTGHVTFPGYLLDTTGAIQLMGAERLITEGHSFTIPGSGTGLALNGFFGSGYPSGGLTAFAGVGKLVPVDLIWLYAPYLASMLGLSALVLTFLARRAGLERAAAAIAGLLAAVPALVYAYLLQGSIKEIALLPTLMLLGALIVLARECANPSPPTPRALIPLGVVGAAGWGTIGFAFTPWLGLAAIALLALGWGALPGDGRTRVRTVALAAAAAAGALVLLALPTVADLQTSLDQASNVTTANAAAVADPGNLLRPLLKVQALGVWLGSSHRGDPEHLVQTYLLIGVMAVAIVLGLVWLLRRRNWALLAVVAVSVIVWLLLTPRATTWTAAKLLVLLSPVAVLVACVGAFGRLGLRRLDGLLVGAAIAVGVLASDAYLYHYTTIAPQQRFDELRQIGERFAGKGPTLTPDFDEYTLYLLRDMAPDAPGNARKVRPWSRGDGQAIAYGQTIDVDALDPRLVDQMATIVVRRSPFKSRPPGDFVLAWRGEDYEVWRRSADAPAARERLPLGAGVQPGGVAACRKVKALAGRGRADGAQRLRFVPRTPNVAPELRRMDRTRLAVLLPDGALIGFGGPGAVTARVEVGQAGAYRLWIDGYTGRALHATIDGRPAGSVANVSGGDGNVLRFDALTLTAGTHIVRIARGGGGLAPGDAAPTGIRAIVLEPLADEAHQLRSVPIGDWRALCGQQLDWIETL
ncbi:MAG TPA: hypothetical protein VFF79_04590 [Conexibacter sp.]|nr:hypothetical protein [Conexibacter sp.]